MPTDVRCRCSDISLSSHRLANVIYRSLEPAIQEQCTERVLEHVKLRRLTGSTANQLMRFQLDARNCTQMVVSLTATHMAANIYDVVCEVEGGTSHRLTYRLPAGTRPTRVTAPQLGQKVAHFLLDELERQLEPGPRTMRNGDV